jgi:hypothetical protein
MTLFSTVLGKLYRAEIRATDIVLFRHETQS